MESCEIIIPVFVFDFCVPCIVGTARAVPIKKGWVKLFHLEPWNAMTMVNETCILAKQRCLKYLVQSPYGLILCDK